MKRTGHNSHRLLVGFIVALIITSFMPSTWTAAISAWPRHTADTITTPFTVTLRALGRAAYPAAAVPAPPQGDAVDWYEQFRQQKQLSERLLIENEELRRWMLQFEQLDELVGPGSWRYQPAYVSARVGGGTPRLTIDRGRSSGVERGQAVIHADHILGIVESAGPVTARVEPLLSMGQSLRVRITPPRADPAPRALEVFVEPTDDRRAFFTRTERGAGVRSGDLAVLADRRYPDARFFLGRVTSVDQDPEDLRFDRVIVTPEIRPDRVHQVVVLIPLEGEGSAARAEGGGG